MQTNPEHLLCILDEIALNSDQAINSNAELLFFSFVLDGQVLGSVLIVLPLHQDIADSRVVISHLS